MIERRLIFAIDTQKNTLIAQGIFLREAMVVLEINCAR
jgi:hypothetical protein